MLIQAGHQNKNLFSTFYNLFVRCCRVGLTDSGHLEISRTSQPHLLAHLSARPRKTYLGEAITDEDFAASKGFLQWAPWT